MFSARLKTAAINKLTKFVASLLLRFQAQHFSPLANLPRSLHLNINFIVFLLTTNILTFFLKQLLASLVKGPSGLVVLFVIRDNALRCAFFKMRPRFYWITGRKTTLGVARLS